MKSFMSFSRRYVGPFSMDDGVRKVGDDLRIEVNKAEAGASKTVVVLECISHKKGTTDAAPEIVVKIKRRANVTIKYCDELGE